MDTKYRTHFVSFLKSIERTNLLQKWLPYSDRFGVKKIPFQLRFTTLALKYIHICTTLCTSFYIYLGGALKKTCQASGKTLKSQGFCGPFPAPSFSAFKKNSISSGNENKNICCRDFFHEIQAYFDLFSMLPEHSGFGYVPKKTLTKFMVSWLLGRFVPESKPSCFFLHTGCTAFLFLKN